MKLVTNTRPKKVGPPSNDRGTVRMSHCGTQTRAEGSEFRSTHIKSRCDNVPTGDLRPGKTVSLLLASLSVLPNHQLQGQWETLSQKLR